MGNGSNVLLPTGGKWVGLVLQLKHAMRNIPVLSGSKLIVADQAEVTPETCFADASVVLPSISDPSYIDRLFEACIKYEVGVIIPTIDLVLTRIAPHKQRFARAGINIACPDEAIVKLCTDKVLFADFVKDVGLRQPIAYRKDELDTAKFPLFYKPIQGYGSVGSGVCGSAFEAQNVLAANPNVIFQEYIDAPEISVDAFISAEGACTVCVPRMRDKVVDGESYMSHTLRSSPVRELAFSIIDALVGRGIRGALLIQMFLKGDEATLIEVNTRIGSGTVLSNLASGGRLYASILVEAFGGESEGNPDDYIENMSLYRFLGDVFYVGKDVVEIMPAAEAVVGDEAPKAAVTDM